MTGVQTCALPIYKEFGTIEEEYFYDRLEDGKYDEGFKERQVKEKKSR